MTRLSLDEEARIKQEEYLAERVDVDWKRRDMADREGTDSLILRPAVSHTGEANSSFLVNLSRQAT